MQTKTSQDRTIIDFFNILIASDRVPNFLREWKFGRARGVNGESDLWSHGGMYPFLSIKQTITVVSDNTQDKPSGTGAHTLDLYGLDYKWKLRKEKITLNGLTPVNSKFEYMRVHRAIIVKAGSTGGNIGTISFKDLSESIVRAEIQPCCNQTLMAVYTIPDGYTGYIIRYYTNLLPKSPATEIESELSIRPFGEVFSIKDPVGLSDASAHVSQYYDIPLGPYKSKTDIKLHIHSNQASDVCGGFLLIMEKGNNTLYQRKGKY